jgi:hypothetical protein
MHNSLVARKEFLESGSALLRAVEHACRGVGAVVANELEAIQSGKRRVVINALLFISFVGAWKINQSILETLGVPEREYWTFEGIVFLATVASASRLLNAATKNRGVVGSIAIAVLIVGSVTWIIAACFDSPLCAVITAPVLAIPLAL